MRFNLVTSAAITPVSIEEAKVQCGLESAFTDHDSLISTYIQAITDKIERTYNTKLMTSTWDMYCDNWQRVIKIHKYPVQSITSIHYIDKDGDEQTLSSDLYSTDTFSEYARVLFKADSSYPQLEDYALNRIRIRFIAGFESTLDVPSEVKMYILSAVRAMYDRRDMSVKSTVFIDGLLDSLPFSV